MEQYLADFRVIRSYKREVSKADAEGHYVVDVAPLPDGQMQFRRGKKRWLQRWLGYLSTRT